MEVARLVLEYVRVLLSPQVVTAAVVIVAFLRFRDDLGKLLRREFKLKSPAGYEFSAPSQQVMSKEAPSRPTAVPGAGQDTIDGWKAAARIWEYRYLHYFLVRGTQVVLDWLANLPKPTTIQAADAWWQAFIPDAGERRAIFDALRWHDLVAVEGDLIRVTDKGREYREFRGPLPDLPPPPVPPASR